jgi:hypothetical protein
MVRTAKIGKSTKSTGERAPSRGTTQIATATAKRKRLTPIQRRKLRWLVTRQFLDDALIHGKAVAYSDQAWGARRDIRREPAM